MHMLEDNREASFEHGALGNLISASLDIARIEWKRNRHSGIQGADQFFAINLRESNALGFVFHAPMGLFPGY